MNDDYSKKSRYSAFVVTTSLQTDRKYYDFVKNQVVKVACVTHKAVNREKMRHKGIRLHDCLSTSCTPVTH